MIKRLHGRSQNSRIIFFCFQFIGQWVRYQKRTSNSIDSKCIDLKTSKNQRKNHPFSNRHPNAFFSWTLLKSWFLVSHLTFIALEIPWRLHLCARHLSVGLSRIYQRVNLLLEPQQCWWNQGSRIARTSIWSHWSQKRYMTSLLCIVAIRFMWYWNKTIARSPLGRKRYYFGLICSLYRSD